MFFIDIIYLLALIIYLPFNLKLVLNLKYRKLIKRRFSPDIEPDNKGSIWIHAVSVGEVRSLGRFVSLLQKTDDRRIVLSVTTPSGFNEAKKIFKNIVVLNGPLDLSFVVKKFIAKIDPDIIILNELEIWPNWIFAANRKKIPVTVVNGRMSDKAFERYKLFSVVTKRFFRGIRLFLLQGENYRERFIKLGAKNSSIRICGNIKADEAIFAMKTVRESGEIFKMLGMGIKNKKILLFASTHKTDEVIFIPLIEELSNHYTIIIAPRHVDRIGEIKKELGKYNVSWVVGKKDSVGNKVPIIFDKMGYLAELMSISDIVFMGGSFSSDIGGHNLYEPAILGKKIVGGPFHNNFPSIGEELIKNNAYTVVYDKGELFDILMSFINKRTNLSCESAKSSVIKMSGAIECSVKEVLKLIN